MSIIEVNNISKVYSVGIIKKKTVSALKNVSLKVEQGSIFGLLGQNGAGKTTLIKILLGVVHPTIGDASMFNTPITDYTVRNKVGFLPENHRFPGFLKGKEVLHYMGKFYGIEDSVLKKRTNELLDLVGMLQWGDKKIESYSKGMMQRIGIAQAVINDPDLIFLDEPTDGVDPIGRKEIRDFLIQLKAKGKTIFLNSHLLSEVEMITDRVAILNKGELVKEGDVSDLTSSKKEYKISIGSQLEESQLNDFLKIFSVQSLGQGNYMFKIEDQIELNRIIDLLRSMNVDIKEIVSNKQTLEQIFVNLVSGKSQVN